ncbi:unnamed protein product [Plasmodium vivax]|uniref:Kinase n=1 Tax=Plasmodium vivax TaxID=5855 RepID=A0A564ZW73_PLAVI|nr:unnamed protein product [Plasmodium vivax]VUZ96497.1 inositol polyphosphate multikinase, putative [Plasmodium vivax]
MERDPRETPLDGDLHLGLPPQRSFKQNNSCGIAEGRLVKKGVSAANSLAHREEEERGEHSLYGGCHLDGNTSRHRNGRMAVANLGRGNCLGCANCRSGADQGELPKCCEEVNGDQNKRRGNRTCEKPQWDRSNLKRQTQRSISGLLRREEIPPHFKTSEVLHHLGEGGAGQGDGHSSTSWNGTDYTNFEDSDEEVGSPGDGEEGVAQGVNFGTTLENISPSNSQAVHMMGSALEHYGWRRKKKKKKKKDTQCRDEQASGGESEQVLHNMANQKLTGTSIMLTGEKSKYIYKLVPFFKNGEARFYMNAFAAYDQVCGQFGRAPRGAHKGGAFDERGECDQRNHLGELHTSMQSAMAYFHLMNERAAGATRKKPPRSSPCQGTPQGGQVGEAMGAPPNRAAVIRSANTNGAHFREDREGESPQVEENKNGGMCSHYTANTSEEAKLLKLLGKLKQPVEEGETEIPPSEGPPACVGRGGMSCRYPQRRSGCYSKKRNTSTLGDHRILAFLVRQKLIPKCYNIVPVYRCEGEEAASYLAETPKMGSGTPSAGSTAGYVAGVRGTKSRTEEPLLNGGRDDVAVRRDTPREEAEKWRVGKMSDFVKMCHFAEAVEGTPGGDPPKRTVHFALKLKKICHSIDHRHQNVLDLKLGYNTLKDNDIQFSERLKEESDSIDWSEKEKYVKRWSRMKKNIRSEHLNTSDEHIIELSARDLGLPPSFFSYDNQEIYCLLKSWKQEITARMTTQRRLGFRICALVCGVTQQGVLTDQGVREFYADCVAKYGSLTDGGAGCCGSEDQQCSHGRPCHTGQHSFICHSQQHLHRDGERPPPSIDHCYDRAHNKLQISRDVGLHLREEHVLYALTYFFKSIVSIVLPKLISLKVWLEEQRVYSFCSTSLLIIYDRRNPQTCDIKWIDFTYSFDNTVSPSRYEQMKSGRLNLDILFGVNNLIKLCRTVFFESEVPPSPSRPSSIERKRSHLGIHDEL